MLDRLLGNYLLSKGVLSRTQLVKAYQIQESNRAKLGVIAVSEKLMTIAQAEQVNALQASMDKKFGDIAIEKGYLSEPQLGRLLELQGNSYLAFVQALVDEQYMTLEQVNNAENDYQRELSLTATDIVALKEGDIERIVPIFLDTEDQRIRKLFSMSVKNLYRLVDAHVYIGKSYRVGSVRSEVMGYQGFHGTENAKVAIGGRYEDVQKMAIGYTKEEFIETEEDALDAVCELINCMNGLYASDRTSDGTSVIELEPPEFFIDFSEAKSDFIDVLPVFICGGEVMLFISTSGEWEVQ
ncbi:MAG: hypothetical protein K6F75_11085 [Butyrivibrio sp.]|nr:hypothetical protein [Butyrivibrio sp.]